MYFDNNAFWKEDNTAHLIMYTSFTVWRVSQFLVVRPLLAKCAQCGVRATYLNRERTRRKKHPHTTEWYTQNDSWREMVCIAAWKNICALFNSNNAWIHTLCKYLYNQGKWKNLDCSGLFRSAITYLFVHNIKSDTKLPPVNWDEWLSWVINTDGTKKRWCYFDAIFFCKQIDKSC